MAFFVVTVAGDGSPRINSGLCHSKWPEAFCSREGTAEECARWLGDSNPEVHEVATWQEVGGYVRVIRDDGSYAFFGDRRAA